MRKVKKILLNHRTGMHTNSCCTISEGMACEHDPSGSLHDMWQQRMKCVRFLCVCPLNDTPYVLSRRLCSAVWSLTLFSTTRVLSCANLLKRLSELLPQTSKFWSWKNAEEPPCSFSSLPKWNFLDDETRPALEVTRKKKLALLICPGTWANRGQLRYTDSWSAPSAPKPPEFIVLLVVEHEAIMQR